MKNKKLKLVNIFQLCMAGILLIQLILLGIVTDIGLAVLWISPFIGICIILNILAAFQISLFKNRNKKTIKFICITLLLLIAWGISWLIQVLNSHYYDNIFVHISFAIVIIFSIIIFSTELKNTKNINTQGEKNE